MIKILGNFFEANPGKSTIVLKSTCSDCGDNVIIHITSTSSGFGLQGGALFKRSSDGYFAKCSDCYKINSKINDLNMSKFARAY